MVFGPIEMDQVAVYAREVFIQQSNRRFVYVPIMTATTIRVIRFYQAGGYYSQFIYFHKDAEFFVKLIILFSSLNEALIGLDTSIYWRNGRRFLSMKPDQLYNPITETWDDNYRIHHCFCAQLFKAYDPDSWRAHGRACESEFLRELSGIKGVAQMVSFLNEKNGVKQSRGFEDGSQMVSTTGHPVLDRFFTRLVLPRYGGNFVQGKSDHQLLGALFETLLQVSHRDSLIDRGILHHDISIDNLVLSLIPDECVVIIDFDMAKKMADLQEGKVSGVSRTGIRAFQSMKVLHEFSSKLGHHDHVDNLEYTFYVLYTMCCGYDSRGNPLQTR
ncbi:hypothetical protein B0H10DRAFT_2437479 [Mycena sp. CBHHK59/15]|nr:hypothetical protein B0H10DRAFT_2437479 [Mycena sp. CBHHK59/15]